MAELTTLAEVITANNALHDVASEIIAGGSAYAVYLDNTTDDPVLTETEWLDSLKGLTAEEKAETLERIKLVGYARDLTPGGDNDGLDIPFRVEVKESFHFFNSGFNVLVNGSGLSGFGLQTPFCVTYQNSSVYMDGDGFVANLNADKKFLKSMQLYTREDGTRYADIIINYTSIGSFNFWLTHINVHNLIDGFYTFQ